MAEKYKETWYFLEPSNYSDDYHFFKRKGEEGVFALWRLPIGQQPDDLGDISSEIFLEYDGGYLIRAYNQLDAIDRLRIYHNILLQKPIDKEWYEEKPA